MKPRNSNINLVVLIICFSSALGVKLTSDNVQLDLNPTEIGSISFSLSLDDETKLSGEIARNSDQSVPSLDDCDNTSSCILETDNVVLNITAIDSGFSISWQSDNIDSQFQDCLDLEADQISWYGGSEKWQQDWPIENLKYDNIPYTTRNSDNGAVSERYWLNSRGAFIFIEDRVPLFLDQNNEEPGRICFGSKATPPYVNRERNILNYVLIVKSDAKEAHLHGVNNYLGKPTGRPDDWVIKNPIWTTWAKYKKGISDDIVVSFAQDIANHGFTGQIEIDDYWETCYGTLTFNDNQFANINSTVQTLHDLGFTVTLWTHPFVNHECEETMQYGEDHDLFVKSVDGSDITNWWDGNTAHYIDFTKDEGAQWFKDRLRLLQDKHGIDAFKFDAGESNYPPDNGVVNGDQELGPNLLTSAYVRTCATFGGLIEVRAGWRTQDLPVLLRMIDKDSRWGLDNGLHSLITTLLAFNINGYTMVLPDMIGGNGYGDLPTAELIARWTQANTFMPTMQFSFLPWEITSEEFDGVEIIKKYVALHAEYYDQITQAMDDSINNGTPVNPPVWWADPTNTDLWRVNDEYLLGENILVAPIIEAGATSRNIVLPSGSWKDGNTGDIYEGPQILNDYPAPIDVLPYFIKQ